jgi:hypothetical protein
MSANLTRRLAKLEDTHKRILRCVWCLYSLREITTTQKSRYQAQPAGALATKCWYCGTPYIIRLELADEHYREAADLVHNSHPVKRLTVERIHAAELWLSSARSEKEKYLKRREEEAERKANPAPRQQTYQPTIRPNAQERKAQAERDDLKTRAQVFVQAKHEEIKRRAGRTEPFPIDEALQALESVRVHSYDKTIEAEAEALGLEKSRQPYYHYTAHLVTIRNAILDLRKREACEVVIWGKSLPSTLEEIVFFEAQLPVAATEALEEQREAREKAAREANERQRQLEEYRARQRGDNKPVLGSPTPATQEHWLVTQAGSKGVEMVEIPSETEKKSDPMEDLKNLLPPNIYEAFKEEQEGANKQRPPNYLNFPGSPFERKEPEPTPPSDNGTLLYQRKFAHWKRTGEWLPDNRCPADWSY